MSGLGEALRDEGDGSFREVLLAASRRALELGNVDLVVRAVLANTRGLAAVISSVDRGRVDLIEEALALVGDAPSPARARLLGQLASELTFSGQHDRRTALADDAVAMARALGDERLLCEVIVNTGYAAITGTRLRQLTDRTGEGVRLADRTGDPVLRVIARLFESSALVATGQLGESTGVGHQLVDIADAEGSPLLRWIASATAIRLELLRGNLRRASEMNDQLMTTGAELGQPDSAQWWAAGAAGMAWLNGEGGALADAAGDMAEQYAGAPAWRGAHAWLLCEAGRLAEARDVLRTNPLTVGAAVAEPYPFAMSFQLATVAAALDDPALGEQTIQTLDQHRGLWAHYFLVVLGPIEWALGLAAAATGALDQAVADLDTALSLLLAQGVLLNVPRLQIDLVRSLGRRGAPGDSMRRDELLQDARKRAQGFGAAALVARIDALGVEAT
jgi:hypothetical protein